MGKIALVTGGATGIGRAIAVQLAQDGYSVAVNYHTHRKEAETLVQQLEQNGTDAMAVCADVTDRTAVEDIVNKVADRLGPISLLVNNAGIAKQSVFQDVSDEEWRRFFAVNVDGARHGILAVLPHMLQEKAGCIINTSSIWGLRGASCEVAYACTKAAVIALTRSLALELAPSHIRVNCVAPGVVDTEMVRVLGRETLDDLAAETPLGRLGKPEDIAGAVSFLASQKADFITGQVLTVDGGLIG